MSRRGLSAAAAILFTAGLLNYQPWRGYNPGQRVTIAAEPVRIASNLLHEGAFANPFGALPTGPTAHIAPGLPFVQFLILRILGEGAAAWLALRSLPVVAIGLELALLPWIARSLGFSAWAGILAAVFGLITKPGSEPQWEAELAGLLFLIALGIACRFERSTHATSLGWASGLVAGIVFHLQPVFALPYFIWVASLLPARRFRRDLPLWTVPLLLCIPWSVRNYLEVGTPFMRDDFGIEMYVSFNACAPYGFQESMERFCIPALHPNSSIQEASELRRLGEFRYNRERLHSALLWISGHSGAACILMAERFWFFWFPSTEGLAGYHAERSRQLFLHAVTLLSLWGLYLCRKHRHPSFRLLSLWLGAFPMVYYLVQFEPRYRYPILWITWILAAHAVIVIQQRGGWRRSRPEAVPRDRSLPLPPASY
jgi:hypothetical protein